MTLLCVGEIPCVAMIVLADETIELPALSTAHSHAFQRAMRGRAQRPGPEGSDDFWSWRQAMYEIAEGLDPSSIHDIARVAYRELKARGVRTVGEFHYVHHQPDGTPYDDRTVLAQAVVEAARAEGMRIALLRVVYHRAGAGKPPEGAQRRFCDASLDDALSDVDALRLRYADADDVRVGVAPHSVRAVPPAWLADIRDFAGSRKLMVHMHVAEQPAEISSCLDETGKRPVELLADRGLLGERFVAVHATHLEPHEAGLLGEARSFVCLCPTTERDLGDGLFALGPLVDAGARICTGVDSHVLTQPLEDLRAVELSERLRTLRRITVRPSHATPAEWLWDVGSRQGAAACGFTDDGGVVRLRRDAIDLALVADEHLLDALVFGSTARVFDGVVFD